MVSEVKAMNPSKKESKYKNKRLHSKSQKSDKSLLK